MPLILRKIRKRRWDESEDLAWLAEDDIPADPLGDLSTTFNALSVWYIEEDRSNLDRVVAASAAGRERLDVLDYALFDQELLSQINIKIKESPGATPDVEANEWHRDLVELSAAKLVNLAKVMLRNAERRRRLPKELDQLIAKAVASGRIDKERLSQRIRDEIDVLLQK